MISFTCQSCHRNFEPDPAMATEVFIGPEPCGVDDPDVDFGSPDAPAAFTGHELAAMNAAQLDDFGLTPATRDALLRGEFVESTVFLCRECQDGMLSAQEEGGAGEEWKTNG